MKPLIKTNAGYLPVNGTMGTQQLLFNHMSNHYRRLYNAKSKVDSSVPVSYHIAVQKDEARRRSRQVLPRSNSMLHGFSEEDVKLSTHQNQSELCCTRLEKEPVPSTRQARSRYRTGSGEQKALESPVKSSRNSSASSTRTNNKTNLRPRSSSRNSSASRQTVDGTNSRSRSASRKKIDLIEEHAEHFTHLNEPFTPRILNTDAQSKLLGLKVYHPPRRRRKTVQETAHQKEEEIKSPSSTDSGASSARSIEQLNGEEQGEEQVPHCTCGQENKPPSRVSSRDSAYSGGVVSPAESRGPTPEHGDLKLNSSAIVYQAQDSSPGSSTRGTDVLRKMSSESTSRNNLCYQSLLPNSRTQQKFSYNRNVRQKLKDSFSAYCIDIEDILAEIEGIIDEKTLLEELVEEFESSSVSGSNHIKKMSAKTSGTEKRLEDAAYVKFVHDITEDILVKGEYSDLGLQLLFEKHIAENRTRLNVARMREEIAVLSAKLGITSDKPEVQWKIQAES